MKISEVDLLAIKQGLRFKSSDGVDLGTVIAVNYLEDYSVYFMWDNEKEVSNWFGNDCDCEIVMENNEFKYDTSNINKEYLSRQDDFNKELLKIARKKAKDKQSKYYGISLVPDNKQSLTQILEKMF